jgi:hypothetical protein
MKFVNESNLCEIQRIYNEKEIGLHKKIESLRKELSEMDRAYEDSQNLIKDQ